MYHPPFLSSSTPGCPWASALFTHRLGTRSGWVKSMPVSKMATITLDEPVGGAGELKGGWIWRTGATCANHNFCIKPHPANLVSYSVNNKIFIADFP